MKYIFLLLLSFKAMAVCDSPISRSNAGANQVLTSSKYNTDLNTVYTAANSVDGSCLVDGSITTAKLDTSDLAVLLKSIKEGCKVEYSSASQVTVSKCLIAIDGVLTQTTTGTNISMGCVGCSSEAASTFYYVYAVDTSTTTALTLTISTTAPDAGGNNGNNRVLGRFYNDASQNIDTYSIDQWVVNRFFPQDTGWINGGALTITGSTTNPVKGGGITWDRFFWRRVGSAMQGHINYQHTTLGTAGSGDFRVTIPGGYIADTAKVATSTAINVLTDFAGNIGPAAFGSNSSGYYGFAYLVNTTLIAFTGTNQTASGNFASTSFNFDNAKINLTSTVTIPIVGWLD